MSNEEIRKQPSEKFHIREETVNSTMNALLKEPSTYITETITLMTNSDPEISNILKNKLVLAKREKDNRIETGATQQVQIVTAGLIAWRLFYNEDPSLPPITENDRQENTIIETDIESIKLTEPHFYNFVRKLEHESPVPRLFRLGAMTIYSLKHPSRNT